MGTANATSYKDLAPPTSGESITMRDGRLDVPNEPDPPIHRGRRHGSGHLACVAARLRLGGEEGVRRQAANRVVRSACGREVESKARHLAPRRHARRPSTHLVAIKGPLTTPVGGGIRSLNVTLRQKLDLYACVRPVRYFEGVPSPVKRPEDVDMVIFRENTEDIYAGIEYKAEYRRGEEAHRFLQDEMGVKAIRFPRRAASASSPSAPKARSGSCDRPSSTRPCESRRA